MTGTVFTWDVRCSDPPSESLGSIGKQHQRMKAMKATLVPTSKMKSSIDCKRAVQFILGCCHAALGQNWRQVQME